MKLGATTSPRKQPVQARSRYMVDIIIASAARILEDEGYGAFTTNRVAEIAGISVGSLYQYFPNKNALIAALSRKHLEDLRASIAASMQFDHGTTLETMVRHLVRNHIAIHQVDPKLHQVLTNEVPRLGAFDWQAELIEDIHDELEGLLGVFEETRDIKNPGLTVFLLVNCVESVVHSAINSRPSEIESGELEEALTHLVLSYLQVPD